MSAKGTAGSIAILVVGVTLLVGLPLRAQPKPESPRVVVGWPHVSLDRKLLVAGSGPAATLSISGTVSGVPGNEAHAAVAYLLVRRSSTRELVATLASSPVPLPKGDSRWRTELALDPNQVSGNVLAPGAYMLQPIVVAGPGDTARKNVEWIARKVADSNGKPPFAARFAREVGIVVVGEEPEKVRAYEAEIASGRPELVYRGLSHLVMHYRSRNRHDFAEKRIRDALANPTFRDVPALADMRHVLEYWIADDRLQAGDVRGAAAVLEQTIAAAPRDATFLADPFRARALLHLARIERSSGDFSGAIGDYMRLLDEHGTSASALSALKERGETYLDAGDFTRARQDLARLVASHEQCGTVEPDDPIEQESSGENESVRCPDRDSAADAARLVRIIDSDRSWFRPRLDDVVSVLRAAFERRDLALLDSIASHEDMKFGAPGAEWVRLPWATVAPHLAKLFREAAALRVEQPALTASPPRRYLLVRGIGDVPGLPTELVLVVDRTPFGWQFSGIGGLFLKTPPDAAPEDPTCPGAPAKPNWRQPVHLKAPWTSGEYMRAGGLSSDIDWASFESVEAAFDFLFDVIVVFDHCGPGLPGWYYNTGPTHQGADSFAIDFMDGYGPIACADLPVVGETCIADASGPGTTLEDLLEALTDLAIGGLTKGPAYGDPLLAAHDGVVVGADFSHADGSTGDPNHIDLGVWPGRQAVSAHAFLAGSPSPLALGTSSGLGAALAGTGAPYWLRHLHLSSAAPGASLGMWVEAGEVLGVMDDTGNSFISHLHFVLRERPAEDANLGNPALWLSRKPEIENDLLGDDDNGKCIRSQNEVVLGDRDGDGIIDGDDDCLLVANADQADVDADGIGDACASDYDNDGVPNDQDSCPLIASSFEPCDGCGFTEFDFDQDGKGDVCDDDRDGDGVINSMDACPDGDDRLDRDGDGRPDGCDDDRDGDGWSDVCENRRFCGCVPDMFRCDPTRAGDLDRDGVDSLDDPCPCAEVDDFCLIGPKNDPFDGPGDYGDLYGAGTGENTVGPSL